MKAPYLSTSLVLSIPLRLLAAKADAPDSSAPATQAETNRRAYHHFPVARGAQAEVQNDLTQGLAALDRQRPRNAQKTSIAWRIAECEFKTGGGSGSSLHEVPDGSCTAKPTRERTVALDKPASCSPGNIAHPGRKP